MDQILFYECPFVILFYDQIMVFLSQEIECFNLNPMNLLSLKKRNNGAEKAIAIENVAKIIIQKCLILNRLDSINIHIKMALATKSKSKESFSNAQIF